MRRLLVVAAALAVLSFAASASAMPAGDGGGGRAVSAPTAGPAPDGSNGFDWWYVAVGVGVVIATAVGSTAIVRANAHRRRLEGLAH